jgi:predicted site-specific integrase-resolvase
MSLADAARELDVSPATLRRWAADGLVPLSDGAWTLLDQDVVGHMEFEVDSRSVDG